MKRINYKNKLDEISRKFSGSMNLSPSRRESSVDLVVYLDGELMEDTDLSRSLFSLSNKLENDFNPILWRLRNV